MRAFFRNKMSIQVQIEGPAKLQKSLVYLIITVYINYCTRKYIAML